MDRESSREIGMRLLALRQNKRNLIFFGSPHSGLGQGCWWKITLGSALQWDALASSPILQTLIINYYTHTHTSPPPIPCLHRFEPLAWQAGLWPAPRMAAVPDGCLLELDYFPCGKVVCLWFMCFLLLRCFSCSHTVLPEHSLGVIFFSPYLPPVML